MMDGRSAGLAVGANPCSDGMGGLNVQPLTAAPSPAALVFSQGDWKTKPYGRHSAQGGNTEQTHIHCQRLAALRVLLRHMQSC